jgi:signal peptidase I
VYRLSQTIRLLVGAGIVALVVYLVFWIRPARMARNDPTMEPTIRKGKVTYFVRSVRGVQDLQAGDIILYFAPDPASDKPVRQISRVIALPGQRISIMSGAITVDGVAPTGYIKQAGKIPNDIPELVVPREHVFVLFDNRERDLRTMRERLVHVSWVTGKKWYKE